MSDRYQIRGRLGRGGIGAVYRGYDSQLDREVAIKRLLPLEETHLNQADTGSLSREASALAKFQHPNVVTIFGFEEDAEGPFVVTELIKGENLKVTIEKGALSVTDFQEFVSQTLDALIAAEQLSLLHRDIKPANLMLLFLPSGKFQVKILDFGLAKFSQNPSTQTLDHKGSFLGSIDYIAPEQIDRRPLDQRTDLYSLGCVCYFALTQKPPFEGNTLADTMKNHLAHNVLPICDIRPDLPPAIGAWVMRMIALHPSDRPNGATAAVAEFEQSKIGIAPKASNQNKGSATDQAVPVTARPDYGTASQPVLSNQTSTQPTTPDGRKILTENLAPLPRNTTTITLPSPKRTITGSQTLAGNTRKTKKSLSGPLAGLGIVVALLIGLIILLMGGFSPNDDSRSESLDEVPEAAAPIADSPPVKDDPGPLPLPNALPPAKPTAAMVEKHRLPVSSDQLVAHFVASEMAYKLDLENPAEPGDRIGSWGNFVQSPEGTKHHYLARIYADKDGRNCPRMVSAGPSLFPELKEPQKLIGFDANSSLQIPSTNAFLNELAGTRTTIFVVYSQSGGTSGQLFRMRSTQQGGASMALIPRAEQFVVSFKINENYAQIVSPFAEQNKFAVATYRREGDQNQLFIVDAAGKRFDSEPKATNDVATTFEVFNVGVTTKAENEPKFVGHIAELAVFNRTLTDEERSKVESHLLAKYFKSPDAQKPSSETNSPPGSAPVISDKAVTSPQNQATTPPVTENLVAHYSARTGMLGEDSQTPAKIGEKVHVWKNIAPNASTDYELTFQNPKWLGNLTPPTLQQTSPAESPALADTTRFLTTKLNQALMVTANNKIKFFDSISKTPVSVFMVVRTKESEGAPSSRLMNFSGKLADSADDVISSSFLAFNANSNQFGISSKVEDRWIFSGAKRHPDEFGIVNYQWDGAKGEGQTYTLWANGNTFEPTKNTAVKGDYLIKYFSIGSFADKQLDADFAEIILYNRLLDPDQRQQIMNWLRDRYLAK